MADAGRGDGEHVQGVQPVHLTVTAVDRDPGLAVRRDREHPPVRAAPREDAAPRTAGGPRDRSTSCRTAASPARRRPRAARRTRPRPPSRRRRCTCRQSARLRGSSGSRTSSSARPVSASFARARCRALLTAAGVELELGRDLGGGPVQHLAQDQHGTLFGREELECRDQCESEACRAHRRRPRGRWGTAAATGLPHRGRVRRADPHRVQPGRTAMADGCGSRARSGRCSWQSGTARSAGTRASRRTGRTHARHGPASPGAGPPHPGSIRTCGSSAGATPAGTAQSASRTSRTHCVGKMGR